MRRKGIEENIIKWYEHYLRNRIAVVNAQGVQVIRLIDIGTPQGGILSVIIWNLVFDELINRIKDKYKNGEVKPVGYADDGTLTAAGTSIAKIIVRLNSALKEVKEWADEMGL